MIFSRFFQKKKKSVKLNGIPFPKEYGGTGYIFIPDGVERGKFIDTCLRTSTVSIQTEEGQIFNRVPIDKVSIDKVDFPDDRRVLGSPVVWLNIPYHDQPVIIGVYNALNEFTKLEEGQFSIQKITKSGHVKMTGRGNTGELFISVNHFSNVDGRAVQGDQTEPSDRRQFEGGKIYMDIQNSSGTAELNVNVKGKINLVTEDTTYVKNAKELLFEVRDEVEDPKNNLDGVTTKLSVKNGLLTFKIVNVDQDGVESADGITSLTYSRQTGLNFIDEFKNQIITNQDQVQVVSKKFMLNSGDQAMVLGNILRTFMDKFIDNVSQITTTTMLGIQPILNIQQIEALKSETENFLSQLGFLENKDNRSE